MTDDVLSNYQEFRLALRAIAKDIYELLSTNDKLNIINSRAIDRLEIVEHKHDPSLVNIEFYSFREEIMIFSLIFKRDIALDPLANKDEIVKYWFEQSLDMVERNNILTAKKFLKTYVPNDFQLIYSIVGNYSKMSHLSNDEIAEKVAKHITKLWIEKLT